MGRKHSTSTSTSTSTSKSTSTSTSTSTSKSTSKSTSNDTLSSDSDTISTTELQYQLKIRGLNYKQPKHKLIQKLHNQFQKEEKLHHKISKKKSTKKNKNQKSNQKNHSKKHKKHTKKRKVSRSSSPSFTSSSEPESFSEIHEFIQKQSESKSNTKEETNQRNENKNQNQNKNQRNKNQRNQNQRNKNQRNKNHKNKNTHHSHKRIKNKSKSKKQKNPKENKPINKIEEQINPNEKLIENNLENNFQDNLENNLENISRQFEKTNTGTFIDIVEPNNQNSYEKYSDQFSDERSDVKIQEIPHNSNNRDILNNQDNDLDSDVSLDFAKKAPVSKRPPSKVLLIENFVRPFTVRSARKLLEKTGKVLDFWMNSIKTHCFVFFDSFEQAEKTRNVIYGLRWPKSGSKLLADFHNENDAINIVEKAKLRPSTKGFDGLDSNEIIREGKLDIYKSNPNTKTLSSIDESENFHKSNHFQRKFPSKNKNKNENENDFEKNLDNEYLIEMDQFDEKRIKYNQKHHRNLQRYFLRTKAKPALYYLPNPKHIVDFKREREKKLFELKIKK
ncbi:sap DNA-binding domain-containing protein [Anaeramoeba ignava]|uniref:Sap DNA-binding domain-containing protein n=1 Tax=Anaeramoeba ignava TaxID=1746090 RepID=A0A9Q0LUC4_ANAIG|nr:sap DNA-binding domain-containing protein [Anaeramoeba ignava]